MKPGRPTIYTEALAEIICTRIKNGESVRSIGRDPEMPNASTIFDWALNNESFSKQYEEAKEIAIEQEAEEMYEIAEKMEDVQRARLLIDTKKWVMSKKRPKKWGDKLDVTSDGKVLPTPIIQIPDVRSDNSDE